MGMHRLRIIGAPQMRAFVAHLASGLCGRADVAGQHDVDIGPVLPQPQAQRESVHAAAEVGIAQHRTHCGRALLQDGNHLIGIGGIDDLVAARPQVVRQDIANDHGAIGDYDAWRFCSAL